MEKQALRLFLGLLFISNALYSEELEFSDFMKASFSEVYLLQKTLVFDSQDNQFKLVACREIKYSYRQCQKYNYYLFINLHVDFEIQKESRFSHQLIKNWLFHKSSIYWLNKIFNDDLLYLNRGFFGVKKQDLKPVPNSVRLLVFPQQRALNFKSSDEGLFSNDFTPLLFQLGDQLGFSGQRNRVFFPYRKKQKHFQLSKQLIDFIAILNHELGHTRYGLANSDTLIGEAMVVNKFENPVRVYNGFKKRNSYYSRRDQKYIDVETLQEFPFSE